MKKELVLIAAVLCTSISTNGYASSGGHVTDLVVVAHQEAHADQFSRVLGTSHQARCTEDDDGVIGVGSWGENLCRSAQPRLATQIDPMEWLVNMLEQFLFF